MDKEEANKLLKWIDQALLKGYITPIYYNGQPPYVLDALKLTRKVLLIKNDVAVIDQNKASPAFQTIKSLQIDRMRAIFNKLSVTPESQKSAVTTLLEKVILSNRQSSELLKYTLYKISFCIITDCQEEFFNETDEGHPLKLARVVYSLCNEIHELCDIIRGQFYSICPLTIPKTAEDGLTGDEFLEDMGFKRKNIKTSSTNETSSIWEDKSQWLSRMTKLLCTYSMLWIQNINNNHSNSSNSSSSNANNSKAIFHISEAWSWLTNMINSCANMDSPSFFVATAFEVVLRTISRHMLQVYGQHFISLLITIQQQILPKLKQDMPRRQCLEEFLERFIGSNGNDFMSLFQKHVDE